MINPENLLELAETVIYSKTNIYCSDLQRGILVTTLRGERKTYEQLADEYGYSAKYLKQDVAPKLWHLLSEALGKKVTKSNARAILEQEMRRNQNSSSLEIKQSAFNAINPLAVNEATTSSLRAASTSEAKLQILTHASILLVDDKPENLNLLSNILEEQGYEVRQVNNGNLALQTASLATPDLILLDIRVPELDAYSICQKFKSDPKTQDIPVIFVTALDESWDKVKAFSIGGIDCITKPFRVAEVLARVENQLRIQKFQKGLKAENTQLQEANQELQRLVTSESLTQIGNPYKFDESLLINLEYPDNTVSLDSPFYITRTPSEQLSCEQILKPGSLTRIQAPRKMGKSSLLLRIMKFAQQQNYKTVKIDFQEADRAAYTSLNKFLRWFCANIGRQLQLPPLLDQYWDEEMGSKVSCGIYFEGYLLKQIETPIVLVLNEVNLVFEYLNIAEEFLSLLCFWHEKSRQSIEFQKLRLVVAHSTEINLSLDINKSPFNLGLPIKLSEFNLKQVQDLIKRHGLNLISEDKVKQLIDMVGGHPYLVRIALYHLARKEITLEEFLKQAPTQGGIYGRILRHHWEIIQKKPALSTALKQILMTNESISLEPILSHQLESMGLIKLDGDRAYISCQMYRLYFNNQYQQKENTL
ncbi:AAA-like domain-containing protein [Mastigocoleus testarum]|uniref:Response regulatory domain-containing protein n=1 Tax=Mastigocoleus testarum BC008 TaxID=371196 RepID=A0A0V8A090_9CYAN|nr:AAA-like domain-containing protein [Mastigocoleus testarum]KST66840.1 hypothetical protein BC008_27005 [Mastigocoleus testarum BC008]KST70178.1 hypothetical protein BC008_36610 [Mastigocoleus testarum BC008]